MSDSNDPVRNTDALPRVMTRRGCFEPKHVRRNTSYFDVQFAEIIPLGRVLAIINAAQVTKDISCLHPRVGESVSQSERRATANMIPLWM